MRKRNSSFVVPKRTPDSLTLKHLEYYVEEWVSEGEAGRLSRETVTQRREMASRLLWFLRTRGHTACGYAEMTGFLAYLNTGHTEKGGRWGNPRMKTPLNARTARKYWTVLHGLFRHCVERGALSQSPFDGRKKSRVEPPQVRPFTPEQQMALIQAARTSGDALRDTALVLFLFDTGARASEVCSLTYGKLDIKGKRAILWGKGSKERMVLFGPDTMRALWAYVRHEEEDSGMEFAPEDPLFVSRRGRTAGTALTRLGLGDIIRRLGRAAGIEMTRCSPHTLRHTFALSSLRHGCDVFSLKDLLGHTQLTTTQRYLALSQSDLVNAHAKCSPITNLLHQKRG